MPACKLAPNYDKSWILCSAHGTAIRGFIAGPGTLGGGNGAEPKAAAKFQKAASGEFYGSTVRPNRGSAAPHGSSRDGAPQPVGGHGSSNIFGQPVQFQDAFEMGERHLDPFCVRAVRVT